VIRTGPIRNLTPGEVRVIACVLASEIDFPTRHDVAFRVVKLDGEPTTVYAESTSIPTGRLRTFETALPPDVSTWEIRIDADPDLVLVTIYHTVGGKVEPSMTYHAGELSHFDLFAEPEWPDGDEPAAPLFLWDLKEEFKAEFELPPNWLNGKDDDLPEGPGQSASGK